MKLVQSTDKAAEDVINYLRLFKGEKKVAVGLSGGVDSSLSATLLVKAGWHVEGITLWLMSGKGACCSEGLIDAAGICEQLGINHHVLDSREAFKKEIVETLVKGYEKGLTPLPCSRCNRFVKFSEMIRWAKIEHQIDYIATGHYARIRYKEDKHTLLSINGEKINRNQLLRGIDRNKDQSYFLYDLPEEFLGSIVLPLGELTKEETRFEAEKYDLRTAQKPESQDLCLVEHHGSMRKFLDNYLPPRKGEIVLLDGTCLGEHDGIEHFTIGQRKGLGISWHEPLHVIKLDPTFNRVVVAPRSEAGRSSCIVNNVNWISIYPPIDQINVEVQIRYRSQPVLANLIPLSNNEGSDSVDQSYSCKLNFENEQFSITPGQAAVFYSGEIVLGGGIIEVDPNQNS